MALKYVDPDQVLVYFAGSRIQGFADGEFITYERMTPGFQEVVGTDGEVTRSKSNDFRSKIVIKLMQSSASNAFLSSILNTDLNAPNGAGVGTFQLQDLNGNTLVSGSQSWIVSYPQGSFDRTAKSREWEIHIADTVQTEGGN